MTYDPGSGEPEDEATSGSAPQPVRTGVGRVDEVIRSVEELEERPLEEHVGVFEAAHTQLRHALDHADETTSETDETAEPDDGTARSASSASHDGLDGA